MKKLSIALCALVLLWGCQKADVVEKVTQSTSALTQATSAEKQKTIFEKLGGTDGAALIINDVDLQSELSSDISEELFLGSETETICVVINKKGTHFSVYSAKFDTDLKRDALIYDNKSTPENFVMVLDATRPEGIPSYILSFEEGGKKAEYIITYNGKDGSPKQEEVKFN